MWMRPRGSLTSVPHGEADRGESRVCAGLHWKFFFRSQEMVPPNPHSNMFGFEYPQAPPVRPVPPPTAYAARLPLVQLEPTCRAALHHVALACNVP